MPAPKTTAARSALKAAKTPCNPSLSMKMEVKKEK